MSPWGISCSITWENPTAAREAFELGLATVDGTSSRALLHANAAYAMAFQGKDKQTARTHTVDALADNTTLDPAGRDLLEALRASIEEPSPDWRIVFEGIGNAVSGEDSALWTDYIDDLQRLLWMLIAEDRGVDFKKWMEAQRFPLKFAPLYHAFVAGLEGEDHLLRVNAEARRAASEIHAGLARLLNLYGTGRRKHGAATTQR